jgi:hypothetical protein
LREIWRCSQARAGRIPFQESSAEEQPSDVGSLRVLLQKSLPCSEILWQNAGTTSLAAMNTKLLIALVGLAFTASSVIAQLPPPPPTTQTLSFSGPTVWNPGASIVLSTQDTYSGFFGGGSRGVSYWLQVNSALSGFLTITGLTYFTFTDGTFNQTFPFSFIAMAGADNGFLSTTTANFLSGDLGNYSNTPIPDGSYHVTDITLALAAGTPNGTYTLRTTTADPRGSIQATADFGDETFPQASFVFTVVPEPSPLALLGLAAVGAGVIAYRPRKA